MKWNKSFAFVLVNILLLAIAYCNDTAFEISKTALESVNDSGIMLASTVDGAIHGIRVDSGETVWHLSNPPLVSQSLSKLEFVKDGKKFRLIPSLEGQLYMLQLDGDRNGLHALPITADALFSSTFQLSSDSLLVGGKEQTVFGFNPFTGEIKYRCGKDGCQQEEGPHRGPQSCDLLICRRVSHVVRAVDLETGAERWNFSVGQDDVVTLDRDQYPRNPLEDFKAVSNPRCVVGNGGTNTFGVSWSFDVENGQIEANSQMPFKRIIWRRQLGASLSRVWVVHGGIVQQLSLFSGDTHSKMKKVTHEESGCPMQRSLYLGSYHGNMYVQLEDGHAKSSPKPIYVALPPADIMKTRDPPMDGRHRISKLTRHHDNSLQRGFYQPSMKGRITLDDWIISNGVNEYFQTGAEPFIIQYGQFIFQKFAFACLIVVIAHLIFKNIYLPYQITKLRGDTKQDIIPMETVSVVIEQNNSNSTGYVSRYDTDYDHIRCLGKGAFGVVFEARHKVDQYHYAVKRIKVPYSNHAKTQLLKEVQTFAHLEHPGIVRYYQAWFEVPPDGWQEQRDKDLSLLKRPQGKAAEDISDWSDDDCDEDEGGSADSNVGSTSNTDIVNEQKGSSVTFSLGDLDDVNNTSNDCDSLIIFDYSAKMPSNFTIHASKTENSTSTATSTHTRDQLNLLGSQNKRAYIYLYISMHLYSYNSLKRWLDRLKADPENRPTKLQLLTVFAQIVEAVAYLHSNGLIHRDLKPSNIMFDNQGHIRIVDFGLATYYMCRNPQNPSTLNGDNESNSLTGNVGTELYMSPEQRSGSHYDHKVDVFALGIIYIELMIPLNTEMERALVLSRARNLQFDDAIKSNYSEEVTFCSWLLNKEPSLRPSCDDILEHHILVSVIGDIKKSSSKRRSVSLN